MIEPALSLLRLALGLGAVFVLGYGFLALFLLGLREFTLGERAALSFGVGALLVSLWMLALAWVGLPFSLPWILGPLLALAAVGLGLKFSVFCFLFSVNKKSLSQGVESERLSSREVSLEENESAKPLHRKQKTENRKLNTWDWLFIGLLTALMIFVTLRATLYPMWAWDEIATWGCKARVFYEARTLDFSCIEAHNYYPNLLPLLLTYLYLCLGQASDHLVKAVFPLWGALLLTLLFSLLRRMGLTRRLALGTTVFLAFNGTIFIDHLYIAYADLALAFYTLGAAGFLYLWLSGPAPRGSLTLAACFCAGMAWCKYEGPPLAATIILAGVLTLLWLRPPGWGRRMLNLTWPVAGLLAGLFPWRLYAIYHQIEIGSDHVHSFYPHQLSQAVSFLLSELANPFYFGVLWPAALLALVLMGRRLWRSPALFLALFLGGNLLAILLAYALAPTSAAEFVQYVRATMDRLLLHITPVAALLVGEGLKELPVFSSRFSADIQPQLLSRGGNL